MYFKRLEIHGFKSFAEPVVIDFHEGITCIVGPNGSGKSNISDAIRWVLGEQSPKALRGGKMQEVIFAGTRNRKPRGMAEVTLVIDNSMGILKTDYNEVAITRRMFRSGESEYLINGNPARLKDIRELIMDTGIGVDGYSIIGQGKIADIVSGKPESRRGIFEEAAGVSMYKNRKEEAERKLEKTAVNLARVSDIIAEIESRIDDLELDSKKAKEYIELREEYKILEVNIILKTIEKITKGNETSKSEVEDLAGDIEENISKKNNIEREMDVLLNRRNEIEIKAGDTRDEIMSLVEELNSIINMEEVKKERFAGIEKEKKHLENDIENLMRKLTNEKDSVEKSERVLEKTQEMFDRVNHFLQENTAEYSAIAMEVSRYDELVSKGQDRMFELHKKIAMKESEIKSIENMRDSLVKRKSEISFLNDTSSRNQKNFDSDLENNRRILQQEKEKILSIKEKKEEYARQQSVLEDKLVDVRKERNEIQLELSRVASRKKTMEEMENNYEGYNFGVKSLMKAALPGVIDVAAELMQVPRGYETAIETAMGASMQNVICETDRDAQTGVRYLKNNRAGRLTFLPVSSINGRKFNASEALQRETGFLGIASDIVSFEEKYRGIYEYLLGRVIIVDTMHTAIKLSKMGTGFKFVTMEGEVVNASGAITGGTYKNKSANILERKTEIKELEEKVAFLEKEILRLKEAENVAAEKLKSNRVFLKTAEDSENEVQIRLLSLKATLKALEERLEEEREHGGRYTAELQNIEEELNRTKDTVEIARVAKDQAKEEIDRLSSEISINIDRHDKASKSAKKYEEEITKAKIELNSYKDKLDSEKEMLRRLEKAIESFESEIRSKSVSIEMLNTEKNQIETSRGVESGNIEFKKEKKIKLQHQVEAFAREKELLQQKYNIKEDEIKRLEIDINALMDRKRTLEIRLAKDETQLDTLKDRLWDEFELPYVQAVAMKRDNFVLSPAVREVRQIKSKIKELGEVNLGAIEEYKKVSERLGFLHQQRDDIVAGRDELTDIINGMDDSIRRQFKENFDNIAMHFQEIFRQLFGGGYAELRMEDEKNPLESGIDIIAQPPGKKLQNITLMSGGEKTMTAIALMFAVLKTKPTPFCILDEVEAALDDVNIDRFSNYLRTFDGIQFALITHQKKTMEYADVLYGITMAEQGVSKVLSLKLEDDFEL